MIHQFTCHVCGLPKTHESDLTTGYAYDKDNNKVCYECCGKQDAETLKNLPVGEKMDLYWDGHNITNWPGTLKITPYHWVRNRHNFARQQDVIWFRFEGNHYMAKQTGTLGQIARVKRLKK